MRGNSIPMHGNLIPMPMEFAHLPLWARDFRASHFNFVENLSRF